MIAELIKCAVAMGLAYMLARNMTSWWAKAFTFLVAFVAAQAAALVFGLAMLKIQPDFDMNYFIQRAVIVPWTSLLGASFGLYCANKKKREHGKP